MKDGASTLNRRRFLRGAAASGATLAFLPSAVPTVRDPAPPEPIRVALLGAGSQGSALMRACLRIPGVRFQAVCDIWEAYNLKRVSRLLQRYGHPVHAYAHYEEMLGTEEGLDAVIIATPDFWHARHAVACLDAGLHVYCEAPMSNSLEDARRMVQAARRAGRLLQIGHQRRSHPRYIFCRRTLLEEMKLIGPIVAVNGQWNRLAYPPLGWPRNAVIDPRTLRNYGYESMNQFRNWRRHKGLSGGLVAERGSHQIDVYNWFLGVRPAAVFASEGINYDEKTSDRHDTLMAVYEYDTPQGTVMASYQVVTGNAYGGYVERFLGNKGTLVAAEQSYLARVHPGLLLEETDRAKWATGLKKGYLKGSKALMELVDRMTQKELADALFVGETPDPIATNSSPTTRATLMSCQLSITMDKPAHQPHLENFFDAIRGRAELTCAGEVGCQTTATVLKVNEAVEAGRRLEFSPDEFTA